MVRMKPEDTGVISLLPHEEIRVDTKMYCKYRGTYPVGVKSVEITDFLGLFTIPYPMMSQIRLTARPRIIPMEQLKIGPAGTGSQNIPVSGIPPSGSARL